MTKTQLKPLPAIPEDSEAEESTLGSILINSIALDEVSSFLKPEAFYYIRSQWIYQAMIAIRERHEAVDYQTVGSELRERGQLEDIGGWAYLTYLTGV